MVRVALIFFCLGAGCFLMSVLFRLQHWPFAGLLRIVALAGLGLGLLLFIIAAVKNRGLSGLLDDTREKNE